MTKQDLQANIIARMREFHQGKWVRTTCAFEGCPPEVWHRAFDVLQDLVQFGIIKVKRVNNLPYIKYDPLYFPALRLVVNNE